MMDLITDRTQSDVSRLQELSAIGWENMTQLQRHEWLFGAGASATLPIFWSDGERMRCLDGPLFLFDDASTNKGAYNTVDLNRVETAVKTLCDALMALPGQLEAFARDNQVAWDELFEVPYDPELYNLQTKTDWKGADVPTVSQMDRYLNNVKILRAALTYSTDPLPESMAYLNWSGANAIEKALLGLEAAIQAYRDKVEGYITRDKESFLYSGEIYSGEV